MTKSRILVSNWCFCFRHRPKRTLNWHFQCMHLNSRLNQSPSVACINHELLLTWQNPFTRSKFMGMERRFCFAHSSTCNVTTRWSGNYLLTGFTLDPRTHSIPELEVGCPFHSIYRQWKSLKMKLIATSGRKLRYRRDDIAAAVGSNWSIKHRSQEMDWTKNLKHGCLFVDVRLLCYLTCCSL